MEITLIRHGKSTLKQNQRITCWEFKNWIQKYNEHGVINETSFPHQTLEKITNANVVITSDLKRAIDSATLLNSHIKINPDPLFREAELPVPARNLRIKLPPNMWSIIMRCLWYRGYSNECEPYSSTKERATRATEILIKNAKQHQSVVLVGHGIMNLMIAKELQRLGWKGNKRSGTKHWRSTTYSL